MEYLLCIALFYGLPAISSTLTIKPKEYDSIQVTLDILTYDNEELIV
jgi:hypothetical protein